MFHITETKPILGWLTLFSVLGMLFVSSGCDSTKSKSSDHPAPTALQRDDITKMDRWAVTSPMRAQADAAVVRERVLYEYHFVDGTARLTPLGRRDSATLARHFQGEVWVLNVRQGGADDELYASRIRTVKSLMKPLGVTEGDLVIVDGPAGGDGLAGVDARRIRKETEEGAGSLQSGNSFDGGTEIVRPIDTPLEGG